MCSSDLFEEEMVDYLGGGLTAVALNSCTAGLYLALKALGIGPGDEVIVPTLTFAATSHVVEWCEAKPVLCDIDPRTLNISTKSILDKISSRTKAVIPVHIAGYPCELEEILEIARNYSLKVIEDAAHAVGSSYRQKKIGQHGDAVVFSFYATKNLSCGEGGMVVGKDQEYMDKIRSLSYFGIDKQAYKRFEGRGSWFYQIRDMGYKFNFDQIHAAIARVQLRHLEAKNSSRRFIASRYDHELDPEIERPRYEDMHVHSRHLYPILLNPGMDRDVFASRLSEMGIGTSVHFIPLHQHEHFQSFWSAENFPGAESIADRLLSLPLFPELSDQEVSHIVESVNSAWRTSNEESVFTA